MNILTKRILIGLMVVFGLMQLVPSNRPELTQNSSNDIHSVLVIPREVSGLLKAACYDCHSTEVSYPWYASVAPFSFWIHHHIEEGTEHLNFSEWATYSNRRKHHKLEEIYEEVEEGEMPLQSYTWMHGEARLSETQVKELVSWAKSEMKKVSEND